MELHPKGWGSSYVPPYSAPDIANFLSKIRTLGFVRRSAVAMSQNREVFVLRRSLAVDKGPLSSLHLSLALSPALSPDYARYRQTQLPSTESDPRCKFGRSVGVEMNVGMEQDQSGRTTYADPLFMCDIPATPGVKFSSREADLDRCLTCVEDVGGCLMEMPKGRMPRADNVGTRCSDMPKTWVRAIV